MNKEELLLNLENSAPEFMYSDTITADKKSKERTIREMCGPEEKKQKEKWYRQVKKRNRR